MITKTTHSLFAVILALLLFIVPMPSNANTVDYSIDTGFGIPYGTLGIRGSIYTDNLRFRLALGFLGAGIGGDVLVTDHVSIGGTYASALPYENVRVLNLTYHFNSRFDEGWSLGLDLGEADEYCGLNCTQETRETNRPIIFFHAGYLF